MKPCAKPIELERLTAWWLDELQDEALEEHLLACAWCAKRAESLAACAQGIRAAVRNGAVDLALRNRDPFLDDGGLDDNGLDERPDAGSRGDSDGARFRALATRLFDAVVHGRSDGGAA